MENNGFWTGFFVALLCCFISLIFIIFSLPNEETVIQSNSRLIPEWKLTTDGKKIDTLFIYKQK